jgi:hypothetical protein
MTALDLGATLPLAGCPICQSPAVRGVVYHAPACPNGIGTMKWAPSDVSAEDARVMVREGIHCATHGWYTGTHCPHTHYGHPAHTDKGGAQ